MKCIVCSENHLHLKFWCDNLQVCNQTCVKKLKEKGVEKVIQEKEREIELMRGHIEYINSGSTSGFFLYEHGGMDREQWLEEREGLLQEIHRLKQEIETLKQHPKVRLHYLF
ncbi:syntaphilin domain-containing protein [Bacillus luti]|uniref:syntaphilin domain-containing protein n=1 Tax=Bacillus luti TaxID=2026191 RepID=UPI000B0B5DE7|nr:syntaphilin domain-containing protein [Bacillus luti]